MAIRSDPVTWPAARADPGEPATITVMTRVSTAHTRAASTARPKPLPAPDRSRTPVGSLRDEKEAMTQILTPA